MSSIPSVKVDPASLSKVAEGEYVHHEGSSKKRLPEKIPELNIIPMLDVCFNLLIFFISTAQFAVGEGVLPADLPMGQGKSSASAKPPEQPIVIQIVNLGGDSISIQLEAVPTPPASFNELYKTLMSLKNTPSNPSGPFNADDPVIIRPDGAVKWGHIVNAFNAAVRARYTNVSFAQPQKR